MSVIQIDAADPLLLAAFWSRVFEVPVDPGSTEQSASLMTSDRVPALAFERTDEPKVWRNRIALRLVAEDFDAHLDRLLDLHVPFIRSDRADTGEGVVDLLDPEGNEFSIVQRRRLE